MLKSPTSILNSIQKMKNNLRMDKQQLKKIKNNFFYLDCKDNKQFPEIKQFDYENKLKQRSKSTSLLKKSKKQINYNQQNLYVNNVSTNHLNNKKPLQSIHTKSHELTSSDNILQDIENRQSFKRNKQQTALINTQKESQLVRNAKLKYEQQIDKLKQCFQIEKQMMIKDTHLKMEGQRMQYQQKIKQILQYANFLQDQIKKQQQSRSLIRYEQASCQVEQIKQPFIQKHNFQCQTTLQQNFIQQSAASKIESQSSPNYTTFNRKDSNLLELCNTQNHQKQNTNLCCNKVTQKYQSIINRLLQQNRKLHLKVQKIYSSSSNRQNSFKQKSKSPVTINWVSYGSISSRLVTETRQIVDLYGKTNNFNNYFTSKQTNQKKESQVQSKNSKASEPYSSRIADSSNYNSNKDSQKSQSIIYRVSNVMSSSFLKQRKDSKTKLSIKNPPYKVKQKSNQSDRLKTQSSCQSNYMKNKENIDTSNHRSSINSNERMQKFINSKFNQNVNDFKFYNQQEFIASNKLRKNNHKKEIFQEDQSQIMNDQMKLKTIKQFKCFTKN